MNQTSKALRAARLLAALLPFAAAAFAADPATPKDSAPAPDAPLHEIGAQPTAAPTPTPVDAAAEPKAGKPNTVVVQFDDEDNNRVSVGDATYVGPGERVRGNAVGVMGPVTVDGIVDGNSVSVMGSNTINGTVHGNAVVVLGTMRVGPHAHIDGNAVAGVGVVLTEPGAYIGGHVVQQGARMDFVDNAGASDWWERAFRKGRPMAFGPHLHVFWILSACTVALYVLLALIFPGGVTKTGEALVERPGITILTGILAVIALPVVFILLLVTVVGIPIALVVLPLSIVCFITFGKAALYALFGRSILGKQVHPALCVLLGVAITICFYLVPILGFLVWTLIAFLGFSCAVTTLFAPKKAAPPAGAPPQVPAAPAMPAAVAAVAAAAAPAEAPAAVSAQPPELAPGTPPPLAPAFAPAPAPIPHPHLSEASLPRAGFWIRLVAILIDVLLVGILTRMHDWFPVVIAVYCAVLWKLRGATIGDIIFGLKVVRADGGPMEWVTVIVRALACFFSFIAVGLGFIWIAFDREKQGWHDKIAGTVVVRHPKGASLV